jgi:hypothetical protein
MRGPVGLRIGLSTSGWIAGVLSFALGTMLAVGNAQASDLSNIGLSLHLLGLIVCGRLLMRRRGLSRRRALRPASPVQSAASVQPAFPAQEVRGSIPGMVRQARFRAGTQLLRLSAALALTSALMTGALLTQHEVGELLALHRQGRLAQAQVFNKEPVRELGHASTGLVYYSFRVDRILLPCREHKGPERKGWDHKGRERADCTVPVTVTGRFRASRADYPALFTGRHLPVTYLPTRPHIHRLGSVGADRVRRESACALLLFLCGGAYLGLPLLMMEQAWRGQLHLARYGVASTGIITGCRPIVVGGSAGRRIGYHVRYEFTLPDGSEIAGRARIPRLQGEPTLVGFPLTVFYNPLQPRQSLPLAAFHRLVFDRLPQMLLIN